MTDYSAIDAYLADHLDESAAELSRLCAQPSVAAQNWGLAECAPLVERYAAGSAASRSRLSPTGRGTGGVR